MQDGSGKSNALVVVIEGVPTALVGAFGSGLARTPTLDRIASQGIVFDQCFVDSLSLPQQLTSLWTGQHAGQIGTSQTKLGKKSSGQDSPAEGHAGTFDPAEVDAVDVDPVEVDAAQASQGSATGKTLWRLADQNECPNLLLTDSPTVAEQAELAGCREVTLITPALNAEAAIDSATCSLMHLFVEAAEVLSEGREGLVWVHSRGLRLPWDVPIDIRNRFTDPDDPDPPSTVEPPEFDVTSETDPDLVVGWGQVASAQMAVFDEGILALRAALASRDDAATWSWLLTSLGGIPMGQHGRFGGSVSQLYSSQLSTPSIVLPVDSPRTAERNPELCQLPDLGATLWDMLSLEHVPAETWGESLLLPYQIASPKDWNAKRQLAAVIQEQNAWLRCPAWSFSKMAHEKAKLFVKPDDRWEVADVASRRPDLVEALEDCLVNFREALEKNTRGSWPDLNPELCNLIR